MIETYKIIHNIYDSRTTSQLFTKKEVSVTRGHPLQIVKARTNTKKFSLFFTNRVTNNWNHLPVHVVKAGTINSFKNALDKEWKGQMYQVNFSN